MTVNPASVLWMWSRRDRQFVCRRESEQVQGPRISIPGKGKGRVGTGLARIWPCATGLFLFTAKHSAGGAFLQGLEGIRMCVVALAQHVKCVPLSLCVLQGFIISRVCYACLYRDARVLHGCCSNLWSLCIINARREWKKRNYLMGSLEKNSSAFWFDWKWEWRSS